MGRLSAHPLRYSWRLDKERACAEQRAAERERVLLARELHDILNHTLTAMVLDADATSETGDEAELRQALRRLAGTGHQSMAELRRLLGVLRMVPEAILHDPLAVLPGVNEVGALLNSFGEGGPRARLERQGAVRHVDAGVGQAAYRVVQESLTIVDAGRPPRVLILTTYDLDSYVYAAISAEASGFLLKDAPGSEDAPTTAVSARALAERLDVVPGIGPTTAQIVLLRSVRT